jgi:hypothetical protein
LSVLLLEYSSTSELEEAAALGVIMSVVTVIVGLVATKLAGGRMQRGKARRRGAPAPLAATGSDPTREAAPLPFSPTTVSISDAPEGRPAANLN